MFFLFFMVAVRDPGFIKNNGLQFMSLLKVFDGTSLCPDCEIIRTGRSRHCIDCGHCVERFDHHCPWLNTCIGLRNHNWYLVYVLVQEAQLLLVLGQSGYVIYLKATGQERNEFWFNETPIIHYFTNSLVWFIIAVAFLIISTGIFAFMMLTIIKVQSMNYWTGLTTNERFSS